MKFHPSTLRCGWRGPLGPMTLAATDRGLAGVWFDGQKHFPAAAAHWPEAAGHPVLERATAQLDAYFKGQANRFELPLDLSHGTPFQQAVWKALLAVAHGTTTHYGELAMRLGQPSAARAVGAAVGRNPVSVIVPCHRVLGAGGSLTGYAGGLERKSALLKLEGAL